MKITSFERNDRKYICLRFLDSDELEQVSVCPVLTSEWTVRDCHWILN